MNLSTKTLTHYIVNSIVTLITVAVLVISFSMRSGVSKTLDIVLPFIVSFSIFFISLIVTTIFLANKHSDPWKMILPVLLSSLLLSMISTLIIATYNKMFEGYYGNAFSEVPWKSVGMILLVIPYSIVLVYINSFTTKFSMVSLSGNIADEWTIKSFFSLTMNNAKIIHGRNFSYIFNGSKILIVRFFMTDQIERLIVFEEDERNPKSEIVTKLENEIDKFKDLNITVKGSIVYLSNIIPNTRGTNESIFLLKNNNLFSSFKKLSKKDKIETSIIEMRLK